MASIAPVWSITVWSNFSGNSVAVGEFTGSGRAVVGLAVGAVAAVAMISDGVGAMVADEAGLAGAGVCVESSALRGAVRLTQATVSMSMHDKKIENIRIRFILVLRQNDINHYCTRNLVPQ